MIARWKWIVAASLLIALTMTVKTLPVAAQPGLSTAHVAAAARVAATPAGAPTPATYPPTGPASTKGDGDQKPPVVVNSAAGETFDVRRAPSIDAAGIARVLRGYGSPAVGAAEAMYQLGLEYGIDPAYCLAFFIHESTAGTAGVARVTKSVGNIRTTPGYRDYKGYRHYASWEEGIEDWYRLVRDLYIGEWGLTTVDQIIPVYAPSSDGNDPDRYVATIKRLVLSWRAGN